MKFAIIVFPGSNCERDCHHVLTTVCGMRAEYVWHKDSTLPAVDAVVLPGGFSYGDYLRAGAIAHLSPIMADVKRFAENGGLVLGICNGFQILTESGLLPGAMLRNASLKFECRDVHLRIERTDSPFTCAFQKASPVASRQSPANELLPATGDRKLATVVRMPIAHMEGNYFVDAAMRAQMEARGQILFRYCEADGTVSARANPNGSVHNIAGVCNVAGNVMGLMPHPERCSEAVVGGVDGRAMFESLVRWVEGKRS